MSDSQAILQTDGAGRTIHGTNGIYASVRLCWRLPDGSVRVPAETTRCVRYPGMFTAAGRRYISWKQLCAQEGENGHFCRDCYGREVVYLWERFPCFDSFDYAHEKRYFRWFFLRENDRLTRVCYSDEGSRLTVTHDVRELESRCCERLRALGWLLDRDT